jgi:hypothetical protein
VSIFFSGFSSSTIWSQLVHVLAFPGLAPQDGDS